MMFSAFDILLRLPLFQGMSRDDLTEVIAHTKLEFVKVQTHHVIAKEGDRCDQLTFILNGNVTVVTTLNTHSSLTETLHSPIVLQPERLFGLHQQYTHTFMAATPCQMLIIQKQDIMKLASTYPIFQINLLNILSTKVQKMENRQWMTTPVSLRKRLVNFFVSRCLYPAGEKDFKMRMTDLAHELNCSRLDISKCLNAMQEEQLLILSRGRITIPHLEHLIQL
jgi:CRP-like cAMP-binding protein